MEDIPVPNDIHIFISGDAQSSVMHRLLWPRFPTEVYFAFDKRLGTYYLSTDSDTIRDRSDLACLWILEYKNAWTNFAVSDTNYRAIYISYDNVISAPEFEFLRQQLRLEIDFRMVNGKPESAEILSAKWLKDCSLEDVVEGLNITKDLYEQILLDIPRYTNGQEFLRQLRKCKVSKEEIRFIIARTSICGLTLEDVEDFIC